MVTINSENSTTNHYLQIGDECFRCLQCHAPAFVTKEAILQHMEEWHSYELSSIHYHGVIDSQQETPTHPEDQVYVEEILDAVLKVPHTEDCVFLQSSPGGHYGSGDCNCNRDTRIAEGIFAALYGAMWCITSHNHQPNMKRAIEAFNEASK